MIKIGKDEHNVISLGALTMTFADPEMIFNRRLVADTTMTGATANCYITKSELPDFATFALSSALSSYILKASVFASNESIFLGHNSSATSDGASVIIGNGNKGSGEEPSIIIGNGCKAFNSIVIGNVNDEGTPPESSILMGNGVNYGTPDNTIRIGDDYIKNICIGSYIDKEEDSETIPLIRIGNEQENINVGSAIAISGDEIKIGAEQENISIGPITITFDGDNIIFTKGNKSFTMELKV
jgi:hypothetical protein